MALKSDPTLLNDRAEDYPSPNLSLSPPAPGSEQTPERIQLAGWADEIGSYIGLGLGRLIKPVGRNTYGNTYRRYTDKMLQKSLQDEEAAELAVKHEVRQAELEETFEGVDGITRKFDVRKGTGGGMYNQYEAFNAATGEVFGTFPTRKAAINHINDNYAPLTPSTRGDFVPEEEVPPSAARTEPSPTEEMEAADAYTPWETLGDPELDMIVSGITNRPVVDDGMVGGVRVRSRDESIAKGNIPPGMEQKIPDEGNIYGLLSSTSGALESHFAKMGKEEVKHIAHEQTRAMANLLGVNERGLKNFFFRDGFNLSKADPGYMAAVMVAGRDHLVASIRTLDRLTKKAQGLNATIEMKLQWRQQAEYVANLQQAYRGKRTEIARALSALRVPSADDAAMLDMNYKELLDGMGGVDQLDHVINEYASLPTDVPARLKHLRSLTNWQRFSNATHELWVNSLLSGWFTHTKNFVGVAATISLDISNSAFTATRQAPYALFGKHRDVTFSDVGAEIFGAVMSTREAARAGARAFWLREDPISGAEMSVVQRSHAEQQGRRLDAISGAGLQWSGGWATFADYAGNAVTLGRAPVRMLQLEDAWWKVIAYRKQLWVEGFQAARSQGKQGADFEEFVADFVMNPTAAASKRAKEKAKFVTLQSDMEGWLLNGQKFFGGHWIGRSVVPFYKTPTNAVLYVADHSPIAPFMKRWTTAMEQGGAEKAAATSRWLMGSGIMGMLYLMYKSDRFEWTGNLSSDHELRAAHKRMGRKPYHVRTGDTYFNYNFIEPISTIVGLIADGFEIMEHRDTDERTRTEIGLALIGVVGYNLTNKTFMTGLSAFIEAVNEPDGPMGARFAKNYLKGLVPGSAHWNDWKRATDDIERLRLTFHDEYLARLPGFSKNLPPRRDLWGRAVTGNRVRSDYEPNPVDEELVRLQHGPERHPTSLEIKGIAFDLEHKEVDWYHKRAGGLAFTALKRLLKSKDYRIMQEASQAGNLIASKQCVTAIQNKINAARIQAQIDLFGEPGKQVESPWNYTDENGRKQNHLKDEYDEKKDKRDGEIQEELDEIRKIKREAQP